MRRLLPLFLLLTACTGGEKTRDNLTLAGPISFYEPMASHQMGRGIMQDLGGLDELGPEEYLYASVSEAGAQSIDEVKGVFFILSFPAEGMTPAEFAKQSAESFAQGESDKVTVEDAQVGERKGSVARATLVNAQGTTYHMDFYTVADGDRVMIFVLGYLNEELQAMYEASLATVTWN